MKEESEFVCHVPCEKCGSSDANSLFSDGHTYCFSCRAHAKGEDTPASRPSTKGGSMKEVVFETGEVRALGARKLTEATCAKWRYEVGTKNGKPVQIANYYKDGALVGQKLRFPDKSFAVKGKISDCLFGQQLWGDGGKMIVITEGEIDALSVSQAQGNKWPVVSIPNGAQAAAKSISKNIEWLEKFDTIVLMFDMDDPGKDATAECAALFSPGKVKVANLPLKDPNELLQAGRTDDLINAIWRAKSFRPDGIVSVDDVIEEALKPVESGLPWCFPELTRLTYGRRFREVYGVGAGTGVGKTDFLTQQVAMDISLGYVPAVFFLEQPPAESLARVAGKQHGQAFHVPDAGWKEDDRIAAFNALRGKFWMYDSFGQTEWDVVKSKIRYLAQSEGIRIFYLDHLTALADTADERGSLEQIMKELAGLANELDVMVTFVSHLSTPEGKPHEEGGRVMIRHFKGSRAIGFWSHFLFGLERDTQSEDPVLQNTTTFRVLKDRKTGRSTGKVFYLKYDHDTAHLVETEKPDEHGFKDEEGANKDF